MIHLKCIINYPYAQSPRVKITTPVVLVVEILENVQVAVVKQHVPVIVLMDAKLYAEDNVNIPAEVLVLMCQQEAAAQSVQEHVQPTAIGNVL